MRFFECAAVRLFYEAAVTYIFPKSATQCRMETDIPEHVRAIKYRVSAHIIKLKLAKNLKFQSRICWRRSTKGC